MFEGLIQHGRQIAAIADCYIAAGGIDGIPPEQRRFSSEDHAWFRTCRNLIGDVFGPDSEEVARWDALMDKQSERTNRKIATLPGYNESFRYYRKSIRVHRHAH